MFVPLQVFPLFRFLFLFSCLSSLPGFLYANLLALYGVAGGALKMGHVMRIRRGPLAHLCTSICIDGPPEYESFGWELKWARDPLNSRHSLKVTTLSLACMCRST